MGIFYEIVKTLVRMLVLLQVGKYSNEADKESQRKDDKDQEFIMRVGKAPLKSKSLNVCKNIGVILTATKAGLVF